jgi:hypothetical protein
MAINHFHFLGEGRGDWQVHSMVEPFSTKIFWNSWLCSGLPDGFFLTKNPNLGKFWRAKDGEMLIYFMAIWNILQTFGIFYDQLVHLVSYTKKNLALFSGRLEEAHHRRLAQIPRARWPASDLAAKDAGQRREGRGWGGRYLLPLRPGVDVIITIFCDFCQFSVKKLAFFSQKPMLWSFFIKS